MKKTIQPVGIWNPQGRYSQGIIAGSGKLLFIAGQTAMNKHGEVVGQKNIEVQTTQVLQNIKAIVESGGGTLKDIVKLTTYVTSTKSLAGMYKVRRNYFAMDPPTSTTVVVKGLPDSEFLVEMEAIAVLSNVQERRL